jgi:hypothetical protein
LRVDPIKQVMEVVYDLSYKDIEYHETKPPLPITKLEKCFAVLVFRLVDNNGDCCNRL